MYIHVHVCSSIVSTLCVYIGLSRSSLVCLAYLLGSDYTPGLEGVGVVNAMEVIGRFQGEGMEPLRKLK